MNSVANSKRIASNTLFLYVRMLFLMCVTLYTSRVVLGALGVEDYGIYNVVGGLTASFAFFSSSLANATQRFLSIEIGKGDSTGVARVYSASLIIYAAAIVVVLIATECVGYWILNHSLVIPAERIEAANWVLHSTAIGLALTLLGSIYDSILIAYENMKAYAYLSIFEAMLRLAAAFVVVYADLDKLKLYALLYLVSILAVRVIMIAYCKRQYRDCRFLGAQPRSLARSILGFIGWNGLGTAVWMINEQGINILLNIFFGPIVNAARGVAAQAGAAVNNFSNSFFTAIRPQIIKSYAAENHDYFYKLIYSGSKYSFYLIWIVGLPIILRSGDVLQLWLKEVPQYAGSMVEWIIIFYAINVLTNPLWSAVQAAGKLRNYVVVGSIIFLSAFPISYILLERGASPVAVFQVLAATRLVYLAVSTLIVKRIVDFSLRAYLREAIWPVVKVATLTGLILAMLDLFVAHNTMGLVIMTLFSIAITLVVIYIAGINNAERNAIISKVKIFAHNVTPYKGEN